MFTTLDAAETRLKAVTLRFASAIKRGYTVDDKAPVFNCRQNYNNKRSSQHAWLNEINKIVSVIEARREEGQDAVAVVHGYNHPYPDVVGTKIYVHPIPLENI